MADKNIQMTQRTADNTGWDNIYPMIRAANVLGLGTAATTDAGAYATAAQGTKADNALPANQKGAPGGVATYDTVHDLDQVAVKANSNILAGILKANPINTASVAVSQVRNILAYTADPANSDGQDGDIWCVYEP